MISSRVIKNPEGFIVQDYDPGLMIDFSERRDSDQDLNASFRRLFLLSSVDEDSSDGEIEESIGDRLCALNFSEHTLDFKRSLIEFVGPGKLNIQLEKAIKKVGIPELVHGRIEKCRLLLKALGCLAETKHYPVRLYCHRPNEVTTLTMGATHFGFVLEGECEVVLKERKVLVPEGHYFSIAEPATIEGNGKCEVVSRLDYLGMTFFGGRLESWGRLKYIDGCTDTVLIHPDVQGAPCYNALYFPPSTEQTQHVHPSIRCGLVVSGEGICKTPNGQFPLTKGKIFFLPPETYHSFHTNSNDTGEKSSLTVIAFHPDSDFGPTDENHPMLNRTYFRLLHRMVSASRTIGLPR